MSSASYFLYIVRLSIVSIDFAINLLIFDNIRKLFLLKEAK